MPSWKCLKCNYERNDSFDVCPNCGDIASPKRVLTKRIKCPLCEGSGYIRPKSNSPRDVGHGIYDPDGYVPCSKNTPGAMECNRYCNNGYMEVKYFADGTRYVDEGVKIYAYCSICLKLTEQCQCPYHYSSNKCIQCNGGVGYSNECKNCYDDQNSDDD